MTREAVVNPGSSKSWLLSLTPLLYFDRIHVSELDLRQVAESEEISAYNYLIARILQSLQSETGPEILVPHKSIIQNHRRPTIASEAEKVSDDIINTAATWTRAQPTLVRPGELKALLWNAYGEWVRYNKHKVRYSPPDDPLATELAKKQIPRWVSTRTRIRSTPARKIPDLLVTDRELRRIFTEVVRSSVQIVRLFDSNGRRVIDTLMPEFLPTVEIIERLQRFGGNSGQGEPARFDHLVNLHQLRMAGLASRTSEEIVRPRSAILHAIRERKRFAALRKRLAELDEQLQEVSVSETKWLRTIASAAKEIHLEVKRLNMLATAFMWVSGAYCFAEVAAGMDPLAAQLVKLAVFNPLATGEIKNACLNLAMARRGLGSGTWAAIGVTRDYIALRRSGIQYPRFKKSEYKFWAT